MTPTDIVTAIHAAGATITTDGEHITVSPPKLVQPLVMDAAKANREKLLSHLIETGRLHTHTQEAARIVQRLVRGREMLWDMEQRGDTEGYARFLAHYEGLLREYEAVCVAAAGVAA